ncbi:MAG: helix-turn-helix transcriptional regulator [Bacteroidia bacterium]
MRQFRELKNLSMAQVATKLNISSRMYAYIETEHSSITLERLVDLCNIFECTLEELLGFDKI